MPSTTDPDALISTAIMHRNQLLVTNLDSQQVEDVGKWFAAVNQKTWYKPIPVLAPGGGVLLDKDGKPTYLPGGSGDSSASGSAGAGSGTGPTGKGRIVQIWGRHYHNADKAKADDEAGPYVEKMLLTKLASQKMHDMGVSYPVLINPGEIETIAIPIPVPKRQGESTDAGKTGGGAPLVAPAGTSPSAERQVQVRKFDFRVQFVWQPKSAADLAAPPADAATVVSASSTAVTPPGTVPAPGKTSPPAANPRFRTLPKTDIQKEQTIMEKFRAFLEVLKKYHFWILCGLIVLLSFGSWYVAISSEEGDYVKQKKTLDSAAQHRPENHRHGTASQRRLYQRDSRRWKATSWPRRWRRPPDSSITSSRRPIPCPPCSLRTIKKRFEAAFMKIWGPMEKIAEMRPDTLGDLYRTRYRDHIKGEIPKLFQLIERRESVAAGGGRGQSRDGGRCPRRTRRQGHRRLAKCRSEDRVLSQTIYQRRHPDHAGHYDGPGRSLGL